MDPGLKREGEDWGGEDGIGENSPLLAFFPSMDSKMGTCYQWKAVCLGQPGQSRSGTSPLQASVLNEKL